MNVTVGFPEDLLLEGGSLEEISLATQRELAVDLYRNGRVSAGRAAELSGLKRKDFEALVDERGIRLEYSREEMEGDLAFALGE